MQILKRLKAYSRASTLIAAAAFISVSAVAAETWRAYTYNAVATVTAVKGLNAMLEAIKKETDGQLSVRLNLGGTLPISATNITQAVSDNVVQMGDDAFFVGSVPIGGVVRLPMLLRSRAEFDKAWDVEAPFLRAEYDKRNVVLLGRYIFPENVMWSKKKLTSLADVAGQKIRVVSPEQAEFIKLLGGIPVTLGTSEVAAAIDRGVIDGVLTATSGYGYVWRDLLKYSWRLNVSYVDSLILVNKGAWEKLPQDTRAKVQAIVDEHTRQTTAAMAAEDQELTRKLAADGMVITEPSAADLSEAEKRITPYWKEWGSKKPEADEALKKVRAATGR
ncbi:TRAP-type C4-dicarboxylate transport system, substrate-binding protein [Variovorax sp. HW608]|uniref:TRAP transporter substrate-binding protein DctP n=1 Tax=Variovorax sp. HW608 TaxID=1034889 RepID=UPI00081FFDA2|nr:TRAP transporter substrate-binding protein DctP [Variovorax sp. HW608]SCK19282.1 TRAP-type C4-dicarboxylate transport system, substrate-binding protein [Variovorax sp. HW608]